MRYLSKRLEMIKMSPAMAAGGKAREMRAEGKDVLSLAGGEPDFDTPDHIKKAAMEAMNRGETKYTQVDGAMALKQAICAKLKRENGLHYEPSQITVGSGVKQVIYNALYSTVNPGDEVIIPAPYWVSYPDVVKMVEGVPVIVHCAKEKNFKPSAEDLDAAISPRTKWLILNSPNNPSGAVYSQDVLKSLTDVLLRHPQVLIMSDDVYEHIIYGDASYSTAAAVEPRLIDRILTMNGVSKAYSMTGWRIGYGAGPQFLIKAIAKIQSQTTSCPCSISQAAAIEALTGPQELVSEWRRIFRKRRDFVVTALNQIEGIECHEPEGAFYAYPSCAELIGLKTPQGALIRTDTDFCNFLLDCEGVALVPGEAFGLSPHFRISFATSMDLLEEACRRISRGCRRLSSTGFSSLPDFPP